MYKQYINGKLVEGGGRPLEVLNPATGEVVGVVGSATAAQAKEALESARKAFPVWSKMTVSERIGWMLKLRDACMAERDVFIELVAREAGRLYPLACADVDWFFISFGYYTDEVKRMNGATLPALSSAPGTAYHIVERQPLGVTVGHLAWNYPMGNMSIKLCPSLAAGCPCIIKPSSKTPLSALHVGEIAAEIGFPAGVINILSGPANEVGSTLNSSVIPRMITMIGSTETGLKIMREASTSVKKFSFELGGNAPVVVMDDADPDEVAANIVAKKTGFAGQTCVNYNRIYVHEKIYGTLAERIAARLKKFVPGKWKDEGVIISPMIDRNARNRMLELIDDAVSHGAKLVTGGVVPKEMESGNYILPALLTDVTDQMRVSKEEIFGPVIPLQPFSSLDRALEQANDTPYGLSAYYFGHRAPEIAKAFEAFNAGEIFVNGGGGTEFSPHSGTKQSGIGCDKSRWSLEEYFDIKYLSMIP